MFSQNVYIALKMPNILAKDRAISLQPKFANVNLLSMEPWAAAKQASSDGAISFCPGS